MSLGAIIVNRVLPDDVPGDYFRARKAQERIHLDEIARRLPPVPRVIVPLFESDVHGLASLERVGACLLAESGGEPRDRMRRAMTKTRRQTLILELVDHEVITSQEMLQRRLKRAGRQRDAGDDLARPEGAGPRQAGRRRRVRPRRARRGPAPRRRWRSCSGSWSARCRAPRGWSSWSSCARRPARPSTSRSPSTAPTSPTSSGPSPETTPSS